MTQHTHGEPQPDVSWVTTSRTPGQVRHYVQYPDGEGLRTGGSHPSPSPGATWVSPDDTSREQGACLDPQCQRIGPHLRGPGCRRHDLPVMAPGPPDEEVKSRGTHVGRCAPVAGDWKPTPDGSWDMWRYPNGTIYLTTRSQP